MYSLHYREMYIVHFERFMDEPYITHRRRWLWPSLREQGLDAGYRRWGQIEDGGELSSSVSLAHVTVAALHQQ